MSYPGQNLSYAGYQPPSGYQPGQQGPGQQGPGQQGPGQQGYNPAQGQSYPGAPPGQTYPAGGAAPGQSYHPQTGPTQGYQGQNPQMGGYGQQQPQMGGYNNPAPGMGFPGSQQGISPEVQQWFAAVDRDHSGKISAKELQAALVTGQGKNFSDSACALMIGIFDHDKSGTIDINEFQQLYNYINQWLSTFRTYDRDQSGHIEENELSQALQQMGYRFSSEFVKFLVARTDMHAHKQVSVDQFIVICVQIQKFTEAFRSRDKEMKGTITIGFEEFLTIALT